MSERECDNTMCRYAREELRAVQDALAASEHDIEAYRGALGYAVRGDHNELLSDGTRPNNGIAEALHAQLAASEQRDMTSLIREAFPHYTATMEQERERAEDYRDALVAIAASRCDEARCEGFCNSCVARAALAPPREPESPSAPGSEFRAELTRLINRFSREHDADTPDGILADYLVDCLGAFDTAH